MQSFKEINGQDNIKNSRTTINDSIKTVMSNNSGTAFPTTNLQVGMKCYRTDLGKTYTLTDVINKTWVEDNHATLADSANKLQGYPLSNGGDSTFGKIPLVGTDGVLEIGKYIDFHSKNGDGKDYSARIEANDDGTISVSGGINATLHGTASSASSVPWTGVTGKPSTYPPSGHNHDGAYPATNGSRASGTWGINVTGSSDNAGHLNNLGNQTALSGGNALPRSGLSVYQVYNNGYPCSYGNVLSIGGVGQGQIVAGWSGSNGGIERIYYRNKRDNLAANWSEWRGVAFTTDIPTNFPSKTGAGASGTWGINITGSAGSANSVAWGNVSSKPVSIVKVASWDGSTLNLTTCT